MAGNLFIPDVVTASDTVDQQAGFFSRLYDASTKGVGSAAISGAMSVYNTFLDYTGQEAVDIGQTIRDYDENWGSYYEQNKDVIDLGGFVATSIIPGGLGIKALKLARSGEALGAVGRALNFAATPAKMNLQKGLQAIAKSGGVIDAEVKAAKRAKLLWETADQTLQGAAAELGVLLTVNDSPIFDNFTAGDFVTNAAVGSVFGGVLGGAFGMLETRGIFKAANKVIEGDRRLFDTVFDPVKYNMRKSDEILIFTENMLSLPENYFSTNFKYKVGGEKQSIFLDTSEAFAKARTQAEKTATENIRGKFNELTDNAENTGQAMFEFIMEQIQDGRAAGHDSGTISDTIGGYLRGIKNVSSLTTESGSIEPPKQFFVNLKPTGLHDLFSEVKMPKKTGNQAYYLTSVDPRDMKVGSLPRLGYDSVSEAFADGYDAVFNKAGFMSINPNSKVIKKTPDLALNTKFYLDLETGAIAHDVVLTGGDLLKRRSDFRAFADAAYVAGKSFKQAESQAGDLAAPSLDASVRFMWAGSDAVKDSFFKERVIDWSDFPLLDRAKLLDEAKLTEYGTSVKMSDGSIQKLSDLADVNGFTNELKLQFLQDNLGKSEKGYDLRHIQAHTNVSRQWFEDAVSNNFARSSGQLQEARSLDEFYRPTTVMMEWDAAGMQVAEKRGFIGPNHWTTRELGQHYDLQIHKRIQDDTFGAVFGLDAKLFQDADDLMVRGVTSQGAGPTGLGAANADYGAKAQLFVQDTGKATALTMQKWRDLDVFTLASSLGAIRDDKLAAAELGVLTTALRRDPSKYYLVQEGTTKSPTFRLVDRDAVKLFEKTDSEFATLDEAIAHVIDKGSHGSYPIKSKAVGEFFDTSHSIHSANQGKMTSLLNAMGLGRDFDSRVINAPPVNSKKYPYFAYVAAKARIGGNTDVAMITAKTEQQLKQLADQVGDDHEVIFKDQVEKFREAKGQYEYSMAINDSHITAEMNRRNVRGDYFPETRAENVLEDYVEWHGKSSDHLVRTGVELKNRQFLSEIGFLSEQYTQAAKSAAPHGELAPSKIVDPFDDYRKTMLNISKQGEYPLLDSINEFADRVGRQLYSKLNELRHDIFDPLGQKSLAAMEQANKLMADAGLGTPYNSIESYLQANERFPKNLIKESFNKVNYWLATTTLRLDFANALVNIISTPIMLGTELSSIRQLIKGDNELAGKLLELTHMRVPGEAVPTVPSTTRLIGKAIQNFFGPEKLALLQRYTDNGDIKGIATLYHEVLDDLSFKANRAPSAWKAKLDAAVEKGSRITGNDFAEELTRFVSADVMRQLSDPLVEGGRMTLKEQNAYISSFVNRVQGNYISSQRPVVFQGTMGSAVSLFQTYSFNVMQQLFRHMENGDKKTLAMFGGLQSMIYGLNGLPFFDAINTHLIGTAAGNPQHKDLYLPGQINSDLGNWMMWGTASAFPLFGSKTPALFSRGDINPRNVTLLPINPLDVPAVSASMKLVGSIKQFAEQVGNGADLSSSFLQALEHQGWSRPLAGFAQLLAGQSTTSKGSLISASNDLETTSWLARIPDRVVNYGGVARLMGARPMDEAIAMNAFYKLKTYDAIDRQRIESLGEAVKTRLGNNQVPDDEELHDFMTSYINAGGRQETFSSSMQRWSRDANQSVVNQLSRKMSGPTPRKLQTLLGGEFLQDYSSIAQQPSAVPTE